MPRGLGETAAGFYRKYGGVLAELGILTKADEPGFRLMAIHFEVAERAYQLLRETGSEMELTVEGRDGERKHPLLQVLRDNSQMVKAWATEFGMTPAARPKLRTDEGEQLSLADILFGQALVREQVAVEDPLAEFARDDD